MPKTSLISPLLWQSLPKGDPDAWLDFLGAHEQWHIILAGQTKTRRQPMDDLRYNLAPHDQMHRDLADALGLPDIGDLASFDLEDDNAFQGWTFIHALDHHRLRLAAGF